jgi:heterodisulfide reductase subunit A
VKAGLLARQQHPELRVVHVHGDLVFPGPREQELLARAQAGGAEFQPTGDLTSLRVSQVPGGLQVTGADLEPLAVDLVVLAEGLVPASGTGPLAQLLGVELDAAGFFQPDEALLHRTGSTLDGIYLAGCAAGPCNVATAITQGRAAVGEAISRLQPGREIELETMTATIDAERCGGCKLCISVCPYRAITFDSERQISQVNEAICRGCGTCVASCPSGAAAARHFTDEQIVAEIGGLLDD